MYLNPPLEVIRLVYPLNIDVRNMDLLWREFPNLHDLLHFCHGDPTSFGCCRVEVGGCASEDMRDIEEALMVIIASNEGEKKRRRRGREGERETESSFRNKDVLDIYIRDQPTMR